MKYCVTVKKDKSTFKVYLLSLIFCCSSKSLHKKQLVSETPTAAVHVLDLTAHMLALH